MEKDSYPRFLKSNIYLNLLNDLQANSLKWPFPLWRELRMVSNTQKECSRMAPWVSNVAFGGDWTGPGKEESTRYGLTWTLSRPGWKMRDGGRKEALWYCHKIEWFNGLANSSELTRLGNSSYTETVNKGWNRLRHAISFKVNGLLCCLLFYRDYLELLKSLSFRWLLGKYVFWDHCWHKVVLVLSCCSIALGLKEMKKKIMYLI